MLINLRNALMTGKRTPTAKDYVQNGLLHHWDSIENIGYGEYNGSSSVWVDLKSGNNFVLTGCTWGADGLMFASGDDYATAQSKAEYDSATIEIVSACTGTNAEKCIVSFDATGNYTLRFVYVYQGKVAYAKELKTATTVAANTSNSWSAKTMSFVTTGGVYFNGEAQTAQSVTDYFGTRFNGGTVINPRANYPFVGAMKAIRYYTRALTAQEIAANYAIDKERFGLP